MSREAPSTDDTRAWRSVSQVKEYDKDRGGCPYRYYLHRIEKKPEKPAAWFPQGLGVHEAVEFFEKADRKVPLEEVETAYGESYAKHTNRLADKTPNFNHWFRSGPYRGEVDIERRYKIGLEQTGKYVDYTEAHPDEVPFRLDDGTPYIEQPFEFCVDGVWVRGFIDQLTWDPILKKWVVRDVKTGKSPGDDFQLAVYAVAVEDEFDIQIDLGDFWMARTGKPTIHYDLSEWDMERVGVEFRKLDDNVRAGNFEPAPDPDKCRFCSVNSSCEFAAAESF